MLRRRWETGRYLRSYAADELWEPITLRIKGPSASELLAHFDDARAWATRWTQAARADDGSERFSIEYRTVQGGILGANRIPARMRIDRFGQLCGVLGTESEVLNLDGLIARTRARIPELAGWVIDHPLVALRYKEVWEQVLMTVVWIAANDTRGLYLRQMDIEGVDTKFVERHQTLLDELLTSVLPSERINPLYQGADFTRRFGFLAKPSYTRFRILDPRVSPFLEGVNEVTIRTDELAGVVLDVSTVFVVENEVTYLAFPRVANSIVVFGSGFALAGLEMETVPWLEAKQIVYWGDIDTHGFDILNRLRGRLRTVQSILMDRETLLAHRQQWVAEPSPTNRDLPFLTTDEASVYRDLVEGHFGPAVRLEQERVRLSLLQRALHQTTP